MTQDEYSRRLLDRIGRNLREKRLEAGETYYSMHKKTGIANHTILNWEMGHHAPTIDKLYWVCKVMEWNLGEILWAKKKEGI